LRMGLPPKSISGTESLTFSIDTWKNWKGLGFDAIVTQKTTFSRKADVAFHRRTKRERKQRVISYNQNGTKVKGKGR